MREKSEEFVHYYYSVNYIILPNDNDNDSNPRQGQIIMLQAGSIASGFFESLVWRAPIWSGMESTVTPPRITNLCENKG